VRNPYPLQWPESFTRTKPHQRMRSRFVGVGFARSRDEMLRELDRLGAINVVLTSDLPLRNDGLPYANGRADDPGIAVWFALPDSLGTLRERVFACDRWLTPAENIRAIALSVEAMRGLERWGMADVVDRAIGGFAALPPGSGEEHVPPPPAPKVRPWREVFNVPLVFAAHLKPAELLAFVKLRHRERIKVAHPDAGGSHELAAELNAALEAAEQELR
jgi:hypothetical protein